MFALVRTVFSTRFIVRLFCPALRTKRSASLFCQPFSSSFLYSLDSCLPWLSHPFLLQLVILPFLGIAITADRELSRRSTTAKEGPRPQEVIPSRQRELPPAAGSFSHRGKESFLRPQEIFPIAAKRASSGRRKFFPSRQRELPPAAASFARRGKESFLRPPQVLFAAAGYCNED